MASNLIVLSTSARCHGLKPRVAAEEDLRVCFQWLWERLRAQMTFFSTTRTRGGKLKKATLKRVGSAASELAALHEQHHALGEAVYALGIVFLAQAGSEGPGEGLIESGLDASEIGLNEVVRRGVALAIDKFDEQLALRIGELLHARGVFLLDGSLHHLHVLVAGALVGQRLQVFVGFLDDGVALLGDGQHLLHVSHQSVVGLPLLLVFERGKGIDVDIVHLDVLDGVALAEHLSHLHHGHKRGGVHVDLAVFGMHPAHFSTLPQPGQRQQATS